ncbi:ferritin-like domain-containing protein [Bacillus massilinigeriensis]|uniref:ferritin-like domain-containing protein n=1 Tax=Bacillus mediterraneensis TaxID=1805474 RepID=UPI0008F9376A|nr:ferritin-like domain-containing protein [Bacillus mediterraneensis]
MSRSYYYQDVFHRQNNDLLKDIQKAIDGEYSAILCYEQLALIAPDAAAKKRIQEIRQDESKHFHQFAAIYQNLTGKKYHPKLTEACPSQYRSGLESAFTDEQETVDLYLDIAERTTETYIKEVFRRAAGDEQNHAVWFLYFLTMLHGRYKKY